MLIMDFNNWKDEGYLIFSVILRMEKSPLFHFSFFILLMSLRGKLG
jgi:hypothetical protein